MIPALMQMCPSQSSEESNKTSSDTSNPPQNLSFQDRFPEYKNFHEEEGLLFWNGYLISTSVEKIDASNLKKLDSLCAELINKGLNPEEYLNYYN